MLNKYRLCVVAAIVVCATFCTSDVFAKGQESYQDVASAIYPQSYTKMEMRFKDYQRLYLSYAAYLGDRLKVSDPGCEGRTVPLLQEVNDFFEDNSQVAGSIDKDIFFVWGTMRHGGMCQTALVFNRNMGVKLVATFRGGLVEGHKSVPNEVGVYVNDLEGLRYIRVINRWASAQTKAFAEADKLSPKIYQLRIYDLHCKAATDRIDVPACRVNENSDKIKKQTSGSGSLIRG